ncbi:MAG TPA: hypothetical protein VFZ85_06155 [Jiangellaceae bacterium]
MNALALAALLATTAAATNAVAAVVQERLAARIGQGTTVTEPFGRLVAGRVLAQRSWWLAVGLAPVMVLVLAGGVLLLAQAAYRAGVSAPLATMAAAVAAAGVLILARAGDIRHERWAPATLGVR